MKNFSIILIALVALTFGSTITGCGPETTTPTVPTDTVVDPGPTFTNAVKIGFVDYELDLDNDRTFGVYNQPSNKTYISVFGNDASEGNCDFNIEFPGQTTGTFTTHDGGGAIFECGTGTIGDIKRQEYSADNSEFTVIVTEYGAPGEMRKGTMSGNVKRGTNTIDVPTGKFEVMRPNDEQ
jgi:hypothetical protein